MQQIFSILVLCAVLRCTLSIQLSLENNENLPEAVLMPEDTFGYPVCSGDEESIDLSDMDLQSIRDDMINSRQISSVFLKHNNIREMPHYAFKDATTLRCLDVSGNKIPVDKLIDFGHKTIEALNLSYQRKDSVRTFSEWADELMEREKKALETTMFSDFPKLRHLDISGNPIYPMPENLSIVMPHLTHMYITNRNFKDLSDNFFNILPKSFKSLHIENNDIHVIDFPPDLKIEALFLDNNPLTYKKHNLISNVLKYLSLSNCTLHTFYAYKNNLKWASISETLPGDVPNLEILDLSWNEFQDIEDILYLSSYNNLKSLYIRHNQLKEFPVGGTFTALENLSLSYNEISMIPGTISGFPSLKQLSLRGNRIVTIDVLTFSNMVLLEVLDLSQNHLESLPANWLEPLANLRHLDLRHNRFVNIRLMFGEHAVNNKFSHFDLYVKSEALKTVDVQDLDYLPESCVLHTC